jgi:hypothetical protein
MDQGQNAWGGTGGIEHNAWGMGREHNAWIRDRWF